MLHRAPCLRYSNSCYGRVDQCIHHKGCRPLLHAFNGKWVTTVGPGWRWRLQGLYFHLRSAKRRCTKGTSRFSDILYSVQFMYSLLSPWSIRYTEYIAHSALILTQQLALVCMNRKPFTSSGSTDCGNIMKILAQSAMLAKTNCTTWFRFGCAQWKKSKCFFFFFFFYPVSIFCCHCLWLLARFR